MHRFPVDFLRLANFYMAGKLEFDDMISRRMKLKHVNEDLDERERGETGRSLSLVDT